eukprot:CAMPEP_0204327820 /NCGR_PEP_ID=MMETSP0469-20131031/12906_2 /ASSEMBLY_ACC=CAM_ASM_000384 /TAXON_ID=2969 /ORGANISM="Oxyrrhis marina" /LENGTH=60 /DNA_ID=CAMNT_0051310117 /DNA_START=68 /DNA_END=250 /DNA_ORIENTATION=-
MPHPLVPTASTLDGARNAAPTGVTRTASAAAAGRGGEVDEDPDGASTATSGRGSESIMSR